MIPSMSETMVNTIDSAEMVWIAAGEFTMGSSDEDIAEILRQHPDWRSDWFAQEKPQRLVVLPGYWMYRYPVTVAQYQVYCEATGIAMPQAPSWGWVEDHPMVNVSWPDVSNYALWANAIIPSEAYWEKAARGAEAFTWPWGNTWDPNNCCNATNACSTQPIGTYPANTSPYGVSDMVGNAWEWCQASPFGDYDKQPARTPPRRSPAASGHVLRGGSWQCAFAAYLRCAFRCFECDTQRGHTTYRRPTTGFRCAVVPNDIP